jgi:flagellar biosynthesis protein FlhG
MENRRSKKKKIIQTVAVTSGKGGVGKTNVVANLAVSLAMLGKKTLILDADLGLSNIDVMFGITSKYNIGHVLNGEKVLQDVIVQGPPGVWILPASSGIEELTHLSEFQRLRLIDEFERLDVDIDYLLIDTGAGISPNVAFFCVAAQRILIVVSPEPTSLTDAYALIKVLANKYQEREFSILVNSVRNYEEAELIFKRLSTATEKFLRISLDYFGFLPADLNVSKAVRMQNTVVTAFPESPASRGFMDIARHITRETGYRVKGGIQFFLGNLLKVDNNVTV